MPSTELMKLAPTLTAEERFKLIVKDLHQEAMGQGRFLTLTERKAIIQCENRAMWEEYTRHIGIMQWADAFWTKDIQTEKLRTFSAYLLLSREIDHLFSETEYPIPQAIREKKCAYTKELVALFEKSARQFYAYREAIKMIESEVYGVPLFNERKQEVITDMFSAVDDMVSSYNRRITMLCSIPATKKRFSPMADDAECYLAKKTIPDQEIIDGLVSDIMDIVDSEMGMLGRR